MVKSMSNINKKKKKVVMYSRFYGCIVSSSSIFAVKWSVLLYADELGCGTVLQKVVGIV